MIERYALHDIAKLRDQFRLHDGVPKGVKQRYNIVPAQPAPVVVLRGGTSTMELMQWGFVSQGSKNTTSIFRYKTHTVRSEDVFKKPMWEKSVRSRRCLVPANGIYVWTQAPSGKVPHYLQLRSSPLFAMAGVYSSWTDSEGRESGMFAIVTEPSEYATSQYAERLPVVLTPEQQQIWLDPDVSSSVPLYDVMRTISHDSLSITRVSDAIFSKKLDSPNLIQKV